MYIYVWCLRCDDDNDNYANNGAMLFAFDYAHPAHRSELWNLGV